jgi:psp operon transcriptional activator
VRRLGALQDRLVNVRVVCATNRDLDQLVEAGRFRADLLYRLRVFQINIPPLRARVTGMWLLLADHFGRRMASEIGWLRWPGFSDAVMAAMEAYRWPGNVRELRNVVERAVYRWQEEDEPVDSLTFDPFASPWAPASMVEAPPKVASVPDAEPTPIVDDLKSAVAAYERSLVEEALVRHRHNQRAAAKALKLSYDQFRHCLRRHGLLQT